MHLSRLFLIQLSAESRPAVLAAASDAFPDTDVTELDSVGEALRSGEVLPPELIVLVEPDAESAATAVQAVDAGGLPRWAVVILGRDFSDLAEVVPPEEWYPGLLARVFRSAVLQHELLYENLRMQGDLRTVARRISHDLYAPLGCIYTSSHVLDLLTPQDTATYAAMAQNIKVSSKEISTLVDRICMLLRASIDPFVPTQVEMEQVVIATLLQLEPEIKRAGATVTHAPMWPEVPGVAPWLQVIWWNLLDNALKHGGPGVKIHLAWSATDDGYRFMVLDLGVGVAPAIRDALFSPFDQLHAQRRPGLGLSIVQRLVSLQGGRCGYEKQDNGMSAFYFTLPARPVSAHHRESHHAAAAAPAAAALSKSGPQAVGE